MKQRPASSSKSSKSAMNVTELLSTLETLRAEGAQRQEELGNLKASSSTAVYLAPRPRGKPWKGDCAASLFFLSAPATPYFPNASRLVKHFWYCCLHRTRAWNRIHALQAALEKARRERDTLKLDNEEFRLMLSQQEEVRIDCIGPEKSARPPSSAVGSNVGPFDQLLCFAPRSSPGACGS